MKIIKTFRQYIQFDEAFGEQAILALLNNIDAIMAASLLVLKDDPTSTVVVIEINQQKWVVKRANTKGIVHALRRAFLPSRAYKNWKNAKKLQAIEVNSLLPIALLEERWGLFKRRSYFVCKYVEATDALNFFTRCFEPAHHWQKVVENICKMINDLSKHGISHRDLNLSNILIQGEKPILIDLDAMREYRCSFLAKRAARKERARFMENWIETPSVNHQIEQLFKKYLYEL